MGVLEGQTAPGSQHLLISWHKLVLYTLQADVSPPESPPN